MPSSTPTSASTVGRAAASGAEAATPSIWTFPIEAAMPETRAVAMILQALLAVMTGNRDGIIERRNEEHLHDFRVAVRRARSALALFGAVVPPAILRRGRKLFKDLGARTNAARDLDVLMLELPGYAQDLALAERAGLETLARRIARENERQYSSIRRRLEGKTCHRALAAWRADLDTLAAIPAAGAMAGCAARAIAEAASGAYQQIGALSLEDAEAAVHRLRIRLKKLRYALEFSRSLTPGGEAERFIDALKQLQDQLGSHQDLVMHRRRIADLARGQEADAALGATAARLLECLESRQARLRAAIAADVTAFRAQSHKELESVLAALA